MVTVCDINKCNGCFSCADICPKKCIIVKDDIVCFNAEIDLNKCVNCESCRNVCPNIIAVEKNKPIEWHQGWAQEEIRSCSSSGGAASSIIKSFIQSGGYVAACLFQNGNFVFEITNDIDFAKKFAGSKYVKSNPGRIYSKVKERLRTDKVLFIGLPCQVAAIKNVIKYQDNLYTIDLICHGTPSFKLLDMYLKENSYDIKELKNIKFRRKTNMRIYGDAKPLCFGGMDDYTISFLSAVDYTENCYNCQYASIERVSDVTLGDCWGTDIVEEEENGISLILCQTTKGQKLIEGANLVLKNINIENAIENNHQLQHPSYKTAKVEKFFNAIANGKSFSYATFICFKKSIIKRYIKTILIKLHLMKESSGGGLQYNGH